MWKTRQRGRHFNRAEAAAPPSAPPRPDSVRRKTENTLRVACHKKTQGRRPVSVYSLYVSEYQMNQKKENYRYFESSGISVSEMDERDEAGTCVGADDGTDRQLMDDSVRIDPADFVCNLLSSLGTVGIDDKNIGKRRVIMSDLIALQQILDSAGNSPLLGDVDELSLVIDLEDGLQIQNVARKSCG